tara:strand:- start:267 stop:758 length:492 start_codon:yes stop_codon:yes gene_type:complete
MSEMNFTLIRELFNYEPDTGLFTWRNKPPQSRKQTDETGCNTGRYFYVHIKNKNYAVHRLIWLHVYGQFPKDCIDHIDGNGLNNKLSNLREATIKQNSHNVKGPQKNGTSGYLGVWLDKRKNKWIARICVDGKKKRLGNYQTPELAYEAYITAKRELHPFTML